MFDQTGAVRRRPGVPPSSQGLGELMVAYRAHRHSIWLASLLCLVKLRNG